jgi:hypothetical protein
MQTNISVVKPHVVLCGKKLVNTQKRLKMPLVYSDAEIITVVIFMFLFLSYTVIMNH